MPATADLDPLDLAALLCSRVCHDLISPVGAIANGVEVIEEDGGEEMRGFALDLIRRSARQASARLQFARMAFGASGSAGAELDIGEARAVAEGFMAGEKAELSWEGPSMLVAKDRVKLLLNLVLLAVAAVPRGGTIAIAVGGTGAAPDFTLRCAGPGARLPAAFDKLVPGEVEGPLDAHAVQPFYAGLLARASGMAVEAAPDGEAVVITARPSG